MIHVHETTNFPSRKREPNILILRLTLAEDRGTRQPHACSLGHLTIVARAEEHRVVLLLSLSVCRQLLEVNDLEPRIGAQ